MTTYSVCPSPWDSVIPTHGPQLTFLICGPSQTGHTHLLARPAQIAPTFWMPPPLNIQELPTCGCNPLSYYPFFELLPKLTEKNKGDTVILGCSPGHRIIGTEHLYVGLSQKSRTAGIYVKKNDMKLFNIPLN